jgi:hypothetical protein
VCCVTYGFPERGEIFESLPVVRLDIALVLVAAGVTTLVYWVNVWWNCSGDGAIERIGQCNKRKNTTRALAASRSPGLLAAL